MHLFLSLSRKGFGETILGMRLARDLRASGESTFFLAHHSCSTLLQGSYAHFTFGTNASSLINHYVEEHVARLRPKSIVLADYFTAALAYDQFGLQPTFLENHDTPVFAIDTWHSAQSPAKIDLFADDCHDVQVWPSQKLHLLCPVPFLSVDDVGSNLYQSLPEPCDVPAKIRRHIRHTFGVGPNDRAVLFCSAEWQHSEYASEAGRRLAESFPRLVAGFLSNLGAAVHLIHVGPKALGLDIVLGDRYHWLPSVSPDAFDNVVASVDLFLSANISATTIAKALVLGVPVMTLQNSIAASTMEQVTAQMTAPPSPFLSKWLETSLPLYPFLMWPLGYHAFLSPLLKRNPYSDAFDVIEMLDEARVNERLHALLFLTSAKEEQLHRHTTYLHKVEALPTGAQRIEQLLRA